MKAQEILDKSPTKPEMTSTVEEYKAKYSQYQKDQKAYKASVLAKLKGQSEGAWLSLVQDFRNMDQSNGATKVMVTSWTCSLRDTFAKENAGREIRPVKDGTMIVGYVVADIGNELTEKAAAQIMDTVAKYPGLFVSDISKESVIEVIEFAEKNAATIAAFKARQARLAQDLKAAKEELAGIQSTVSEVTKYGDKPGKGLAGMMSGAQARVEAVMADMAEPMVAVN
jgi:hypothetical protein